MFTSISASALRLLPLFGLAAFAFTSCAPMEANHPSSPAREFSADERAAWKRYLAVSPLSEDNYGSAAAVRATAPASGGPVASHVRRVASYMEEFKAANLAFSEESARITGNHELAGRIAEYGVPLLYDGLRQHEANETFFDNLGHKFAEKGWTALAQLLIEADRRGALDAARARLLGPVYEQGKQLVYAEEGLNREMKVAPSAKLADTAERYHDGDLRRRLVGTWSQQRARIFTSYVWTISANGSYNKQPLLGDPADGGQWSVAHGRLQLHSNAGAESYSVNFQDEKAFLRDGSGDTIILRHESNNPGDAWSVARRLGGNGGGGIILGPGRGYGRPGLQIRIR